MQENKLLRIGVFYDGNYFLHVSNYYNYDHLRRKRLSISGLHDFIRHQASQEEDVDVRLCQIVDAHYFRGRMSAQEASQKGDALYWDRVFDDILMSEGVTTHYLPIKTVGGKKEEKGIDVWLALEAFELAFYKKFDVLVLIAADGDYVPLVRKLNTLGTRVMVLSWDFEYTTITGQKMTTRTSRDLLQEASYPISMHELIDNRIRRNESLINNLFVQQASRRYIDPVTGYPIAEGAVTVSPEGVATVQPVATNPITTVGQPVVPAVNPIIGTPTTPSVYTPNPMISNGVSASVTEDVGPDGLKRSEILSIKNGFGFIKYPPNNLFFHYSSIVDADFNELREGDAVEFKITRGERGDDIAVDVRLIR